MLISPDFLNHTESTVVVVTCFSNFVCGLLHPDKFITTKTIMIAQSIKNIIARVSLKFLILRTMKQRYAFKKNIVTIDSLNQGLFKTCFKVFQS